MSVSELFEKFCKAIRISNDDNDILLIIVILIILIKILSMLLFNLISMLSSNRKVRTDFPMEGLVGFEPTIRELQSRALPLGYRPKKYYIYILI